MEKILDFETNQICFVLLQYIYTLYIIEATRPLQIVSSIRPSVRQSVKTVGLAGEHRFSEHFSDIGFIGDLLLIYQSLKGRTDEKLNFDG